MDNNLSNSQDSSMIDQSSQEAAVNLGNQNPQAAAVNLANESSLSSDVSHQDPMKQTHQSSHIQEKQFIESPQRFKQLEEKKLRFKQLMKNHPKGNSLNFYMCNMQYYFANQNLRHMLNQNYNLHSIINQDDEDRIRFSNIFQDMQATKELSPVKLGLNLTQSRGIAAVLGMGIGDALGSCTQFHHFNKQGLGIVKTGFSDLEKRFQRSGKVSVWTDDASMGLCMADSILLNDYHFNPTHMRYLFILWLQHGLNNGGRDYSIGLGGNISISMYEFMKEQNQYTRQGDRFNNGNGSLMRLAPVPVAYANNLKDGIDNSGKQSLTTHNGLEAEQCARLMGNIIIQLINRDVNVDGKQVIVEVCDKFKSKAESVVFLAQGRQESEEFYKKCCSSNPKFKSFNKTIQDRNWNWREKEYTYAPTRLHQQPGYIGSYCMDALSMALHTVMFTESFAEVVIKNADMGGDCDTVGSIAGQIAGALYGVDQGMLRLYSEMEDFTEKRYEVFLKGYKLINRKTI